MGLSNDSVLWFTRGEAQLLGFPLAFLFHSSALDKRSQPSTMRPTSLLRTLANQLSPYGLTQAGDPVPLFWCLVCLGHPCVNAWIWLEFVALFRSSWDLQSGTRTSDLSTGQHN